MNITTASREELMSLLSIAFEGGLTARSLGDYQIYLQERKMICNAINELLTKAGVPVASDPQTYPQFAQRVLDLAHSLGIQLSTDLSYVIQPKATVYFCSKCEDFHRSDDPGNLYKEHVKDHVVGKITSAESKS